MMLLFATLAAWAGKCTVLMEGEVWLGPGNRRQTDIRLEGDRIAAVGDDVHQKGCAMVSVKGLITPGFIDARSVVGTVEVPLENTTVDNTAPASGDWDRRIRASFNPTEAYNPRSTLIPVTRLGGITSAVVHPQGGLVSGQSTWVEMAGSTQADTVLGVVAVQAQLASESRAEALDALDQVLEDAKLYRKNRSAYDQNRLRPLSASGRDLQALFPVLDGKHPLVVAVDRASDIEAVLRLANMHGLRLVISGGAEAWMHADALAQARIPVMVDPLLYVANSFGTIHARPDNAKVLAEAGVPVIVASRDTHNARSLRFQVGNAVREGLSFDQAMAGITTNVADAFGQSDRGRIAVGAVANLAVWAGTETGLENSPFDPSTELVGLYIGGEAMALESRQTALFDRYRTLP